MESEAKGIGRPANRVSHATSRRPVQRAYHDFTVVCGYVRALVVIAVLVALGIAEALLDDG